MDKSGLSFAPTNIALVKYWGKRDTRLNLPMTGSLSIALPKLGAWTQVSRCDDQQDRVSLNNQPAAQESAFYQRLVGFLDIVRPGPDYHYQVETHSNIPIAAGLASSACGFAALAKALNVHHNWQLSDRQLSILARQGSGSACRSLWNGFVQWHRGERDDGQDSYGEPLDINWPEVKVGLLMVSSAKKPISSGKAMQITTQTSRLYQDWPARVGEDLIKMKQALADKDFALLGQTAQDNAVAMHATMLDSRPPIEYSSAQTYALRQQVQQLCHQGLPVYFTQDAGPNVKVLFLPEAENQLKTLWPKLLVAR
jgi:diphosphomevalonate decarboxylase